MSAPDERSQPWKAEWPPQEVGEGPSHGYKKGAEMIICGEPGQSDVDCTFYQRKLASQSKAVPTESKDVDAAKGE